MHLLTLLPTAEGEIYWIVHAWKHNQSNLFLLTAHFMHCQHQRVSWDLLNYHICMIRVTCSLLMHLLTSLPTSTVGEFTELCMYGCIKVTCFLSSCICSLHCQHQKVSFTKLCMYGCMTRVTCFSSHLLASLPTSVCEFYWLEYVCMDAWPE